MKKNRLNIKNTSLKLVSIAVFVLFVFSACNKFLDIKPEGEFPAEKLLKDAKGFESAMYGVYATMPKKSLYGENLTNSMLELLAQSFTVSVGSTYTINLQSYNYKYEGIENDLLTVWKDMYNNIASVNNVIKNLERFSASEMKYYNLYKGEALGLRAFMHFDLLRLYAERGITGTGIPYSKDFSQKPPSLGTKTTEVYAQIIADLKAAEVLLKDDEGYFTFPKMNPTDNYVRDRETHFNLYAVQATLARVYFTQGDMPNALLYAEKVIESGKFTLLQKTEIAGGLMKGVLYPQEAIFGLYSKEFFASVKTKFYDNITRFSYTPRNNIEAIYKKNQVGHDYRWDSYFKQPVNQTSSIRFVKLVDQYQLEDREFQRPPGLITGINMIRLPEMYYIAAEALLDKNAAKATEYFDVVLESRGLTGLKDRIPAQTLNLELITEERYKEFLGEGQNFLNMKRLNSNILDVNQNIISGSNAIYVFPIPIEETDYRK